MCTENLNPDVVVVKAAKDWRCYDAAHVLDGSMHRRILVERPVRPLLIIV